MYRKSFIAPVGVFLFFSLLYYETAIAQFSLSAQIRPRAELRNGFGNLALKGSDPAVFISQRTRLSFGYTSGRIILGVSLQDVRVWGQDASSISNMDGNKLMLHEGWADLILANKADTSVKFQLIDYLSLKIGRQELQYDDARLLGNLDWLQQGRRHDMVLLKTVHRGYQVDVGFAYNQNSDAFGITNTSYVPANVPPYIKNSSGSLVPTPPGIIPLATAGNSSGNSSKTGAPVWINPPGTNGINQDYKSFASLYISRKIHQTKFSGLFFNDNFGKYKLDSIGTASSGYVYGRRFVSAGPSDVFDYSGLNRRYTYGLMINHTIGITSGFGKIDVQAAYYIQSGKNRDGVKMKKAFHYTVSAAFQKGKISIIPGYDVLSGNDLFTHEDEKFDPLYGTPHRHWGYMDYFYVGTGSPGGGLNNPYLKFKYATGKAFFGFDIHHFFLNKNMPKDDGSFIDRQLGNELDFTLNYTITKSTNIELGYSTMIATASMPVAKGQATSEAVADMYRKSGNWFYAMIRFAPELFNVNTPLARR
jgi:Alginate export